MLVFAAGIYLIFNYFFTEIEINKYETMKEVRKHQAIERGWVPDILPKSAYDIAETHDLDTNKVYGRFYYKEEDEAAFMQQLQPVHDSNDTYKWQDFLFKPDTKSNSVRYRNKPSAQ